MENLLLSLVAGVAIIYIVIDSLFDSTKSILKLISALIFALIVSIFVWIFKIENLSKHNFKNYNNSTYEVENHKQKEN
ncbi:hypothetical protein SAMN06265182_1243 [Persephonella hydrogeniphila]|uniref:Uncharacterized protein n=1 Tax=Persephonella hydrogeniphila TaxID=198703 RepID=A0A285NG69_9AQUI|nr:hypothetical protein [Persephonella hydrogeniphila]SNZ08268.1 hypothetical protein SAMN06265182_1243 [Persephonella hydrogeniphila]